MNLEEVHIACLLGRTLSLSPFLSYQSCKVCSTTQLFLLEFVGDRFIGYNAVCNHRLRLEDGRHQFDAKFGPIKRP